MAQVYIGPDSLISPARLADDATIDGDGYPRGAGGAYPLARSVQPGGQLVEMTQALDDYIAEVEWAKTEHARRVEAELRQIETAGGAGAEAPGKTERAAAADAACAAMATAGYIDPGEARYLSHAGNVVQTKPAQAPKGSP